MDKRGKLTHSNSLGLLVHIHDLLLRCSVELVNPVETGSVQLLLSICSQRMTHFWPTGVPITLL